MTRSQKIIGGLVLGTIAAVSGVFLFNTGESLQKFPLSVSDAHANQHFKDEFSKLTDSNLNTRFVTWNPPIKPYRVTYDLFDYDKAVIKRLIYHINNGNPSTQKYYYVRKDNGQEVLFFAYKGGIWFPDSTKRIFDLPDSLQTNASSFIIESQGGDDWPLDFELWGDFTKKTTPLPTIAHSPLSDLMGVVVKPWDIDNIMYPEKHPALQELGVKRVRLYNDYIVNHNDDGTWNLNEFRQVDNMKSLKAKGISTQMCYLALPTNYPWPPTNKNNVETYLKLAQDVYTLAKHSKDNGDYFSVFELLNEQDHWYHPDINYHFDGYQLAAMMSTCYDGHKGKYPGVGLKASGSTAQFSIGGVAEAEPYLLYQIMEWSEKNRGKRADGTVDLPFDIYSFHLYSSLEGQRQGIPGGISPEYGMSEYMNKINTFRKRYAPWLKIHVGEWGWDINSGSLLNAPAFGKYSAHQTSAMWTVRALLSMAENEINADSYFRIQQDYNASDANPTQFETMALWRIMNEGGIKQPDGTYTGFNIKRTTTGDYFRQLAEFFNNGWVFDSRVSSSPNVLKFKKGTSEMYVIWESENMTVTNRPQFTERTGTYNLNVKGTLRRFVDDSSGVMSSEPFAGGNITYGSKPVIVVVGSTPIPPEPTPPTKLMLNKRYFYDHQNKRWYEKVYDNGTGTPVSEFSRDYQWYKK